MQVRWETRRVSPADAPAPRAAKDRVHAFVKERILDGAYPGGALLSEGEVAAALGVSRTPVREAFLLLEAEGLMRLYPKRGALVVPVTPDDVREVMETRLLIEGYCAAAVARARPPEVLGSLAALLARQEERLTAGDLAGFVAADRDFHHEIVRGAGNGVLTRVSDGLRDRQRRMVASTVGADPAAARRFLDEHRGVLEALERGDAAGAERRLRDHLEGSRRRMEGARPGGAVPPPT